MIKFLKTLKNELKDKNIYLWDIGTDSMWLFYCVAVRDIDIQGFVTNDATYYGESFLNRPIISPERFREEENAILLMSNKVTNSTSKLVSQIGECCYWENAVEWNPDLQNTSISVFGLSEQTWKFVHNLDEKDITLEKYWQNEIRIVKTYNLRAEEIENEESRIACPNTIKSDYESGLSEFKWHCIFLNGTEEKRIVYECSESY